MTTERAKVFRAIKICVDSEGYGDCVACPYFNDPEDLHLGWCNKKQFGKDMKELLEPKKPVLYWFEDLGIFACADCNYHLGSTRMGEKEVEKFSNFCPKCGREVDWSEYQ